MPNFLGDRPAILVTGIDIPDQIESVLRNWFIVRRAAGDCGVAAAVFIAPRLDFKVAERLDNLRRELPCTPLVLITAGSVNNLRGLKDVVVEEVVFFEDESDSLVTRIMSVTKTDAIERFLHQLTSMPGLDDRLRSALVVACRSTPPIRTVGTWAHKSNLSRSTLLRAWAGSRSDKQCNPSSFLSVLVAYHYVEQLRVGRPRAEAARAVGVDPRTAESACRELLRFGGSGQSSNKTPCMRKPDDTVAAFDGYDLAKVLIQLFDAGLTPSSSA